MAAVPETRIPNLTTTPNDTARVNGRVYLVVDNHVDDPMVSAWTTLGRTAAGAIPKRAHFA